MMAGSANANFSMILALVWVVAVPVNATTGAPNCFS